MPEKIYVSLDLETTGLSSQKDKIIEVGAVKFSEDKKEIARFKQLVNPRIPIPFEVTATTGIKDKDVEGAPTIDEILPEIKEFIGDAGIVGHNIEFDTGFLAENGLELENPLFDTWHLSSILLPFLDSHSLEYLTKYLKIEHLEAHRALADAEAARELFLIILDLIKKLDQGLLEKIVSQLKDIDWSWKEIFKEAYLGAKGSKERKPASVEASAGREKIIPTKDLKTILRSEKIKIFKHFDFSLTDLEYSKIITEQLGKSEQILIEANTKPASFLLPALSFALNSNKKVVIAVHDFSKTLRDLESLKKITPLVNGIKILKDPSNYICQRRFQNFQSKKKFDLPEIKFLIKMLLWLDVSESGDKSEIVLSREDKKIWSRVSFDKKFCFQEKCQYPSSCLFFHKTLAEAVKAPVIIVSHKFLLSDGILPPEKRNIPKSKILLIDDAGYLGDSSEKAFNVRVSKNYLESGIKVLKDFLLSQDLSGNKNKEEKEKYKDILSEIKTLENDLVIFWGILGMFWNEKKNEQNNIFLSLENTLRYGTSWNRMKDASRGLILELSKISGQLDSLFQYYKKQKKDLPFDLEFSNFKIGIDEFIAGLEEIILTPDFAKNIYWMKFLPEGAEEVIFYKTPKNIKSPLKKVFSLYKSIILSGPALSIKGKYNYLSQKIGLDDFKKIQVLSKKTNTLAYVVEDMIAPTNPGFKKESHNILEELFKGIKNNIFVIFSSQEAVLEAFKSISPIFPNQQILAQGVNLKFNNAEQKIREAEKTSRSVTVFAKKDLFLKIPTENFQTLILTKTPFQFPFHPVLAYQVNESSKGFLEHTVPQAVIKFKEIFEKFKSGSKESLNKKKAFIILDSRISEQNYGLDFLQSLEGCELMYGTKKTIEKDIKKFMIK